MATHSTAAAAAFELETAVKGLALTEGERRIVSWLTLMADPTTVETVAAIITKAYDHGWDVGQDYLKESGYHLA
jgi:ABC-type Fe3+ transport system substrate-binding protein